MNFRTRKINKFTAVAALFVASSTMAQDFRLFEPVENSTSSQAVQQRSSRESRATTANPDFTLIGTSRVGDRFSVILADRDGEKIVVSTQSDANTRIPGHDDFQIISTENGKVSISLPASSTCVDFPKSGVNCNGSNIAELSFPENPPVKSVSQAGAIASTKEQEQDADSIEENPQNPFAIMRARAQNAGTDNSDSALPTRENNGRINLRRIDPSEVPPGMRIVSTPFGDRLVQQ